MNPCFAIIDHNTLSRITLRNMLSSIYDQVEVFAYRTMDEFIRDSNRHFVHFFVDSDIIFEDAGEFETLKAQTTVLCNGNNEAIEKAGFRILDCTLTEQSLVSELMQYETWKNKSDTARSTCATDRLSKREKDVLVLIVKGLINKEIAEILNISTPTVIFHRNNICEKLQTRSIGKLTVYAVLAGLIELNEI